MPSGLKATLHHRRVASKYCRPAVRSHKRTVRSSLAEARRVTGAEGHAGHLPPALASLPTGCPRRAPMGAPSGARPAEARRVPSGLKATLDTAAVWPSKGLPTGCPVALPQAHRLVLAA